MLFTIAIILMLGCEMAQQVKAPGEVQPGDPHGVRREPQAQHQPVNTHMHTHDSLFKSVVPPVLYSQVWHDSSRLSSDSHFFYELGCFPWVSGQILGQVIKM